MFRTATFRTDTFRTATLRIVASGYVSNCYVSNGYVSNSNAEELQAAMFRIAAFRTATFRIAMFRIATFRAAMFLLSVRRNCCLHLLDFRFQVLDDADMPKTAPLRINKLICRFCSFRCAHGFSVLDNACAFIHVCIGGRARAKS